MSFQQYNVYEGLTACRLAASSNQTGTYFNGSNNDGVGATFTYSTGALTIDSVVVEVGDSILLAGQTNKNENGIYICTNAGATGVSAVLQRRNDYQSAEQLRAGQYVSIGAGTVHAGAIYVTIEPLPQFMGVSDLNYGAALPGGAGSAASKAASDVGQPTVASVVGATTANALSVFADTAGSVKGADAAVSLAEPLTVTFQSSSATPGTLRSLIGIFNETNATMTSGNVVGVRGVVNCVSASGGFIYGVQGKVVPTGTLSGSIWAPAVFGQYDISAATINGGQTACIWGDYGATSGTISDASGMRGIAMTNTTAAVLNAQDYRYGNATYLLELAGAGGTLNYYAAAGTSAGSAGDAAHCAAQQVIKIEINGVAAYIPVFTQNT